MTNTDRQTDIWATKPWWCQPWTIVLTGVAIVSGSWLVLHRVWLSAIVTVPIVLWWWTFLIIVPRSFAQRVSGEPEEAS
ncbi:MAG: DUF6737 family protein [Geitlerinemataceae cyanobacterium]